MNINLKNTGMSNNNISNILVEDGDAITKSYRSKDSYIKDRPYLSNLENSQNQLLELFSFCRKRLDESSLSDLVRVIPLDEERSQLEQIEMSLLFEYLKQIISYLVKSKIQLEQKVSQFDKPQEDCMNEYEGMLQKLEAECRQHIGIEQLLKNCAETTQEKLDVAEKDIKILNGKIEEQLNLIGQIERKNKELINLNEQLGKMNEEFRQEIEELSRMKEDKDDKINQQGKRIRELEEESEKIVVLNNAAFYGKPQRAPPRKEQEEFNQQSSIGILSQENSSKKRTSPLPKNGQTKRLMRSVSTLNSAGGQIHQEEGTNTYHQVIRSIENNNSNGIDKINSSRIMTEPFQGHHTSVNLINTIKGASNDRLGSSHVGSSAQNTLSQDALAYLLGSTQQKAISSQVNYVNNKSLSMVKDEKRNNADKYLLDKGEGSKKTSLESGRSKPFYDLNKSGKNNNLNNNSSHIGNGSKTNSGKSNQQSQQALLIKTIQQQQIIQQAQSQAVLHRIQQKIQGASGQLQHRRNDQSATGSSKNSNGSAQSLSHSQRPLSRSKSRTKIRDGAGSVLDNSKNREYNIYSINPPNLIPALNVQAVKNSPGKTKSDSHRSNSVDAYGKLNSSKPQQKQIN